MIFNILKWLALIGVLAFLVLVIGPCVYYGWIEKPDTGMPDMPNEKQATYSFYIENTGGLILSSDYEQHGQVKGSRLFILHGYWEMRGNKFKHLQSDLPLDENVFGPIIVKRREK